MMPHNSPYWPWCVQAGVTASSTLRIDQANYGDGYVQRITRGLNPRGQKFQISVPFTSMADLATMDSFLLANATSGFWFTGPGWPDSGAYDVFVYADEWASTITDKNTGGAVIGTLSAEFIRCYNPQPIP
jgi:phage-related protein